MIICSTILDHGCFDMDAFEGFEPFFGKQDITKEIDFSLMSVFKVTHRHS